MTGDSRFFAGFGAVLVVLSLLSVPAVAAQTASGIELTVETEDVEAGDDVTVEFTAENTGDEPIAVIIDVADRPDWELEDREDDDGVWRSDDEKWLFQTVEAGASVSPSITLEADDDATGEYTVEATASESGGSTSDEGTIVVEAEEDEEDGGVTSLPGPGFGTAGALVALIAVALLARARN